MKIALISGSSRGIGKAITKLLLNNKWRVYGFSRNNNITHPNFYHKTVDLANLKSFNTIKFPEIKTDDTILLINNASIIGNITQLNKKLAKEISSEYNLNIISPTIMCGKFLAKYQYNKGFIKNGIALENEAKSQYRQAFDKSDVISKIGLANRKLIKYNKKNN